MINIFFSTQAPRPAVLYLCAYGQPVQKLFIFDFATNFSYLFLETTDSKFSTMEVKMTVQTSTFFLNNFAFCLQKICDSHKAIILHLPELAQPRRLPVLWARLAPTPSCTVILKCVVLNIICIFNGL